MNTVPEFIQPKTLLDMSDEEIDNMLEQIRIRRKQKLVILQMERQKKEEYKKAKLEIIFQKKIEQAEDALEKVDRAFEKLERRINETRALRLQLGEVL